VVVKDLPPGRPKAGQPPWGAAHHAKQGSVGAKDLPPGRPKAGQPPWGAGTRAKQGSVGASIPVH